MKQFLCIDIGGTSMKIGVLNEEGEILKTDSIKSPDTIEKMYQIIEDVFHGYENIEGLALSMPGAVDSEKGIIGGSSALDYWPRGARVQ